MLAFAVLAGLAVGRRPAAASKPVETIDVTSQLWPLPVSVSSGTTVLRLDKSFAIRSASSSGILQRAVARYQQYVMKYPSWNGTGEVSALVVEVASSNEELQFGVDESYSLSVDSAGGVLTAPTVFGALRGLETFSQLVNYSVATQEYLLPFAPYSIQDFPRFPYRGMLLDTSRHFIPIPAIKKVIEGLSFAKLNTLHWHITDSQSFPLQIYSWPRLWTEGRWNEKESYSQADVKDLIDFARDRGVRILPEFDMPGHTASWAEGHPDFPMIVCLDKTRNDGYCASDPCGQIDPTDERTYEVISGLMKEVSVLFPDMWVGYGADEVKYNCWTDTPHIAQWMEERNMTARDLLQYFEDRVMEINSGLGKRPVFWEEIYVERINVPADSVIQIWLNPETMVRALNDDFPVVLSNYEDWYLDCMGLGYSLVSPPVGHNWCEYNSWEQMYLNEPFGGIGATVPPDKRANLLGGEACLWSERTDEYNVQQMAFPRVSAVAERLWSAADALVTDPEELVPTTFRMLRHRCHLVRRGIAPEPLEPGSSAEYCESIID